LELATEEHVVIRGQIGARGEFPMSKSRNAITSPAIMASCAIVGCLAVFALGALGVTELKAEPQSIADARTTLAKGGACSLFEWPNYEQRCQFDARQPTGEMRKVRIIATR
jgi:hypothetical protein